MIDLIRGTIKIDNRLVSIASDDDTLDQMAKVGLIERRLSGRGTLYYYLESVAADQKFGVFVTMGAKSINWIRLSWLDTPLKEWKDVSEKAVKDEFRMLIKLVEETVGRRPDNTKPTLCTWRLNWGSLQVSCDLRSFQADIYMKPN